MSLPRIIVSLTTVSYRINYIKPVIDSLLTQTIKPSEIRLYISAEPYLKDEGIAKNKIPKFLLHYHLRKRIKIIYTKNIGPYRKLLPLLKEKWNSPDLFITVDDDVKYKPNMIKTLYDAYHKHQCIVAMRGHRMRLTRKNNKIVPDSYSKWFSQPLKPYDLHINNLLTGCGGVIYHSSLFTDNVFDPNYMKLAPTADDIWFTFTRKREYPICIVDPTKRVVGVRITNNKTLFSVNRTSNDIQIKNVVDYLHLDFTNPS